MENVKAWIKENKDHDYGYGSGGGNGYVNGSGYGWGDGLGLGDGSGFGDSSGRGDGDGWGSGWGDGIDYFNGEKVGHITSGAPSPTLGANIAFAYVKNIKEICTGSTVQVMIREKLHDAEVVKRPFVEKRNKIRL